MRCGMRWDSRSSSICASAPCGAERHTPRSEAGCMPIVTISRMYGSGGSEVAEQVAHALGWDLLDNELVDAVAVRLGVSSAEVSAREERVPSLAERFADALSLGVPEAMPAATVAALPPTDERLLD